MSEEMSEKCRKKQSRNLGSRADSDNVIGQLRLAQDWHWECRRDFRCSVIRGKIDEPMNLSLQAPARLCKVGSRRFEQLSAMVATGTVAYRQAGR